MMKLTRLIDKLRRWMRRDPQDPYAWVRVPLRRGPRDRSGAVALREPD